MADLDVTCACGAVIHTSTEYVGRTIRCRCGRPLLVALPDVPSAQHAAAPPTAREATARRARRQARAAEQFVLSRDDFETAHGRGRTRTRAAHARNEATTADKNRGTSFARWWRTAATRPAAVAARFPQGLLEEIMHSRLPTRVAARAMLAYTALLLVTWLLLITTSERWLPTTLLLYGPRGIALLPLVLLIPLALLFARHAALLTVPALWLSLWGIMGFRFSVWPAGRGQEPTLRVMSLNAQGGALVAQRISTVLEASPDVVGVQECSEELAQSLRIRGGFAVLRSGAMCVASRWPITFADSMPRLAFQRIESLGFGGSGRALRYRIAHPTHPFQVVNLHLETPRKGLGGFTRGDGLVPDDGDFTNAVPTDRTLGAASANAEIRLRESERASGWAASKRHDGPLVITGDFNQPVESTIFREYWRPWTDAFESRGRGFGYTKVEGTLLRARIDHVLTWPGSFRVIEAVVGADVGSDHRPIVATLQFR